MQLEQQEHVCTNGTTGEGIPSAENLPVADDKFHLDTQQLEGAEKIIHTELASLVCVEQCKAFLKLLLLLFAQEACKGHGDRL